MKYFFVFLSFMFFCFVAIAEEQIKDEKISIVKEIKSNGETVNEFEVKVDSELKGCQKIEENTSSLYANPRCRTHSNSKCSNGVCWTGYLNMECTVCFEPSSGFWCQTN